MIRSIALFISLLAFSSCSNFFAPTKNLHIKVIDIDTKKDVDSIICKVTDGSNTIYYLPTNPGIIKVRKSSSAFLVVCKKTGYMQFGTSVGQDFDNTTSVHVLSWTGFNIDQKIKDKKYHSHYLILMKQSDPSQ